MSNVSSPRPGSSGGGFGRAVLVTLFWAVLIVVGYCLIRWLRP
jgi:hypothetical protein